jgi:hypothetical protein
VSKENEAMRNLRASAGLLLAATIYAALAQAQPASQSPAGSTILVTPDNFNRAETDMNFAAGSQNVGKFSHHREPMSIDFPIVRPNRDTLYSLSVFDLDAGPVTVTLPSAGQRFMSMQVIDEDHYTPEVIYGAGTYTFTREKIGTRYVSLGVRILVDLADPEDIKQVHALQDAITVTQPGGPGRFEVPNWDQASQKKVRDALLALAETLHGLPAHRPFWSISLYTAEGHFQKNPFDAYTLNSITAKKSADGGVTVQFGGCNGNIVNCLPFMKGWNYMVRLYHPRAEILNGTWKLPEAQPVT